MSRPSRWLPLFESFIEDLRISSKEVTSPDDRGIPLVLWESQRRFLNEIATGLDDGVRSFLCLKSRQLGCTSIALAIDVFWLAMHKRLTMALVTENEKNREKNRAILRSYINSFPAGYFGESFHIVKGGDNRRSMTFSNGSRIDFLVAGTKNTSTSWGEGEGYAAAHLTELGSYGSADGLKSFEEAFAQGNEDRLFIYESTGKGFNYWADRWMAVRRGSFTEKAFFIGWWANDMNRIQRDDARFAQFGRHAPSGEERSKVASVAKLYGYVISPEQLAWIRWRQDKDAKEGGDRLMLDQNQPWTETDAFIATGYSFFQTRQVVKDIQIITNAPKVPVSEGGHLFQGYRYTLDGDFRAMRLIEAEDLAHVELRVWEEPSAEGRYAIGVDPAWGRNDHKDRSCLSDDTEILTDQGWRFYDEVSVGDQAVCYDLETGAYSYGAISDKVVKPHDGPMYRLKSKGLDCLATPDHRVVSRNYRVLRNGTKQTWRFYTAEEIAKAGRSVREIPVGGAPVGNGIPGLSIDMCRALGWILTDGHITKPEYVGDGSREGQKKRRPAIIVAQALRTEKAGVMIADEMERVFTTLCPKATIRKLPAYKNITAQMKISLKVKEAEPFIEWLTTTRSRIPRRILTEGSADQLEALFQGILEGDGHWTPEWGWTVISPGLDWNFASDCQELAARLGYSASVARQKGSMLNGKMTQGQWIVRLSVRDTHTFEATNVAESHYVGTVWCVTVPTGAFVIRRNGKMSVTGNCISAWRCYADKMVQVAEYATAEVEIKHVAWVLAHLAGAYSGVDCIVNYEVNGPGNVIKLEWDNLRAVLNAEMAAREPKARDWQNALGNARWYLFARPDSGARPTAIGFSTTFNNKSTIMHGFRGAYVTGELLVRSVPLLTEMLNVKQDGNKIEAAESKGSEGKDDRVFGAAFAHRAWHEWIRRDMIGQGMTYADVTRHESGPNTLEARVGYNLKHQVMRFLQTQAEAADNPPRAAQWRIDRHLA